MSWLLWVRTNSPRMKRVRSCINAFTWLPQPRSSTTAPETWCIWHGITSERKVLTTERYRHGLVTLIALSVNTTRPLQYTISLRRIKWTESTRESRCYYICATPCHLKTWIQEPYQSLDKCIDGWKGVSGSPPSPPGWICHAKQRWENKIGGQRRLVEKRIRRRHVRVADTEGGG